MKIKTKLLIGFFALLIPFIISSVINILQFNSVSKSIAIELPKSADELKMETEQNSYAQLIRYYDEVLTQSARNYAFTGDVIWKVRYDKTAGQLTDAIDKALATESKDEQQIFKDVDSANNALVDMETRSIAAVDKGDRQTAIKILNSQEYLTQKEIYSKALEKYAAAQGKDYDEALSVTQNLLKSIAADNESHIRQSIIITLVFAVISLIIGISVQYLLIKSISNPIYKLTTVVNSISQGDYSKIADESGKDEVSFLAKDINIMAKNLKSSKENIEKQVNDRTIELDKKIKELREMNDLMIGRELKMVDLKKELDELKKKNETAK